MLGKHHTCGSSAPHNFADSPPARVRPRSAEVTAYLRRPGAAERRRLLAKPARERRQAGGRPARHEAAGHELWTSLLVSTTSRRSMPNTPAPARAWPGGSPTSTRCAPTARLIVRIACRHLRARCAARSVRLTRRPQAGRCRGGPLPCSRLATDTHPSGACAGRLAFQVLAQMWALGQIVWGTLRALTVGQPTVIWVPAVPVRHEIVIGQLPGRTCLPTLQVQLTLPAASDVAESSSSSDG